LNDFETLDGDLTPIFIEGQQMRIIVIGQAAFGAGVLEGLLANGEEVVAAYPPPDLPGKAADALKISALEHNIPVIQPQTFKDDRVFAGCCDFKPDLVVLAFVPRIIPVRYLELPTNDAICFHPSLLPRHRGASAINWALIMGDTQTGLSIFWPDAGIDTGPILLQRKIDISPDDTAGSLYFNHLFPMGIEALVESVELIKAGKAPRIAQTDEGATYEPPCDDRVADIDWDKPASKIYNLIRGCDPQPGAFAFRDKKRVRFYSARLIPDDLTVNPGSIVRIESDGMLVALKGGLLKIGKIRPEGGGKVPADQFAFDHGLSDGDRFDIGP
jgi:methionyl-tRNA formyltransferase